MSYVIMSRLRNAIWPLHEHAQTAGPLGRVLRKTCSIEEYTEALVRMHGFTAPAERMIEPHIASTLIPLGYEPVARLGHLEKDLMFLGHSSDQLRNITECETIPQLDTVPKALGCLYLFEGSRLGGQVLTHALQDHFGFRDGLGYAYFGSDGVAVQRLWDTFKMFMEDFVTTERNAEEIIGSAVDCFSVLNEWLAVE